MLTLEILDEANSDPEALTRAGHAELQVCDVL